MPEGDAFLDTISAYIATARAKAADGLSVSELAELTVNGMRLAIQALDKIEMPGADKKAEVLKLCAFFFDTFADACVPTWALPFWWIVKAAIRALIMSLASGAIEAILRAVR